VVLTIGRNLSLNRIRKERLDTNRERSLDDEGAGLPEAVAAGGEEPGFLTRTVAAAVDALPAAQREAILLFYVEDRSLDEVSAMTGRPINTVKSDLLRARKELRAFLEVRTGT
jgi:RNA polymerase sigma-70 factor (ECF subfamily)